MGVNLPIVVGSLIDEKMSRPISENIVFKISDWVGSNGIYTCSKQLSRYSPLSNVIVELIDTDRDIRKEEQKLNVTFSISESNAVTATTWRIPVFDLTYRFLIDIDETEFNDVIIRRIEELEKRDVGTNNYEELDNLPSINSVTLIGDKTLDEIGAQEKGDYVTTDAIPTKLSNMEIEELLKLGGL